MDEMEFDTSYFWEVYFIKYTFSYVWKGFSNCANQVL